MGCRRGHLQGQGTTRLARLVDLQWDHRATVGRIVHRFETPTLTSLTVTIDENPLALQSVSSMNFSSRPPSIPRLGAYNGCVFTFPSSCLKVVVVAKGPLLKDGLGQKGRKVGYCYGS